VARAAQREGHYPKGLIVNGHRTWGIWLVATLGSFAWWERKAFQHRGPEKPSQTLTATFRCWLGVKPLHRRRYIAVPAFAALLIYLWGHMVHGRWNA
jgi:hypothetical protein